MRKCNSPLQIFKHQSFYRNFIRNTFFLVFILATRQSIHNRFRACFCNSGEKFAKSSFIKTWRGGWTNKENDKTMPSEKSCVHQPCSWYILIGKTVCCCKYPPERDAYKKCNYQLFREVSLVNGALTVWSVNRSYFQGHFKTLIERGKNQIQICQIKVFVWNLR